jgi:hypothetical protein
VEIIEDEIQNFGTDDFFFLEAMKSLKLSGKALSLKILRKRSKTWDVCGNEK